MDPTVFIVLCLVNAAAVVATLVLAWNTRRFLARAVRTRGTVVPIKEEVQEWPGYGADHPPETTRSYRPRVSFALEDGSVVEFDSRTAHPRAPLYSQGSPVPVVYEREAPTTTAEIAGAAVWRRAILCGLATAALLVGSLLARACA